MSEDIEYRWFFCEHCHSISLPYIPDENGFIKGISEYCTSCKKEPSNGYLEKIDRLTGDRYFKRFWYPFNEINCLSLNMCKLHNMPEVGHNSFLKSREESVSELKRRGIIK